MYNLNVNLAATAATAANNLLGENNCTTPRTPEILNSLIAMTNPMDNYHFGDDAPKIASNVPPTNTSSDSNSSSSSQVESPTGNNPPSIQHTCSQLIKAGLKLTIEQKRKQNGDCEDLLDLDTVKRMRKNPESSENEEDRIKLEPNGLTPEDEERRRRRRERNKIAATKCRLKKRERIANLITESETLETQNVDLKNNLQELRNQERMLLDILTAHRPNCLHNIGPATKESLYKLPPVSSVIEQHSYNQQQIQENLDFRNQNSEIYSRPTSSNVSLSDNPTYNSNSNNNNNNPPPNYDNKTPPSIIVEEIVEYDNQQFLNLDSINSYTYSNSPCHNYSVNQNNYGGNQEMDNGCMA